MYTHSLHALGNLTNKNANLSDIPVTAKGEKFLRNSFIWEIWEHIADSAKSVAGNTLIALTLMITKRRTEEKDTMVNVVVNLINQRTKRV